MLCTVGAKMNAFAESSDVLVVDPSALVDLGVDGIADALCKLSQTECAAWWSALAANPLLEQSLTAAVDPTDDAAAPPLYAWLQAALLAMRGVKPPKSAALASVVPDGFLRALFTLHGALLRVKSEKVQESIARLCEVWWSSGVEGCESLVAQLMPYRVLVLLSRGRSAAGMDVMRVWQLRDALLLFDTEDESFDSLRALLLRCATLPVIYRAVAGRRLLSFLFARISASFMLEMHQVIMAQIVQATKRSTMPTLFGEVYYRAWSLCGDAEESEGEGEGQGDDATSRIMKVTFEERCVQDCMSRCVRTASASLHAVVRSLLASAFHSHKKDAGVDGLLCRLWEPIVWRSLRAAHPTLRLHATHALCDAFPLQDPDGLSAEENAALLDKQFDVLNERLRDDDAAVRVAAAKGVCRVLASFWKLTPAAQRRKLLCTLVDDVANDVASTSARVAVMEGIATIVEECVTARTVLKGLLPRLRKSLHDRSPKVRAAFLSILIAVKTVRGVHFSSIAPVQQILDRLAADGATTSGNAAAALATKLLVNSYFPAGSGRKHLERCVALVQQNAAAARIFYAHAHAFVSAKEIVALAILIIRFVDKCPTAAAAVDKSAGKKKRVASKKRKQPSKSAAAADGDEDGAIVAIDESSEASKADVELMANLLATASTLWASVARAVRAAPGASAKARRSANAKTAAFQKALSGGVMPRLIKAFGSDPKACGAVLALAGHLPMGAVPALKQSVLDGVRALVDADAADAEDATGLRHVAPLVDTMCSWEQESVILDEIVAPCLARVFAGAVEPGSEAAAQAASAALDIVAKLLQTEVPGSRARTLAKLAATSSAVATLLTRATTMLAASVTDAEAQEAQAWIAPQLLRAVGIRCMAELHAVALSSGDAANPAGGAIHALACAARAALDAPDFAAAAAQAAGMGEGENSPSASMSNSSSPPRRRSKKSTPAKKPAPQRAPLTDAGADADAEDTESERALGVRVVALACAMVAESAAIGRVGEASAAFVADCSSLLCVDGTIGGALPQELARLAFTASKLASMREAGSELADALDACACDEDTEHGAFLAASRKVTRRRPLAAVAR